MPSSSVSANSFASISTWTFCDVRQPAMNRALIQRLVALFFGAMLALNYPLLGLWHSDARWFGIPAFPAALFGLWLALIGLLAWLLERSPE